MACFKPPPPSTLDLEPVTCESSVSALDPSRSYADAEVIFPAFVRSQLTVHRREQLMSAIRAWLRRGAAAQDAVLGKLLVSALALRTDIAPHLDFQQHSSLTGGGAARGFRARATPRSRLRRHTPASSKASHRYLLRAIST